MSQLATIFEKIKEDFFKNHLSEKERENYKLIFSPFSTGFTYDDFLFLDSNTASEDAQKYVDELLEFSQIANTIPREDNFWAISGNQNDYLFNVYKNILQHLRLLDPETLRAEMLYSHPIFLKAVAILDEDIRTPYLSFFDLRKKISEEIQQLKESISEENRGTIDLEIEMKEQNLIEVEKKWLEQGKKEEVEKQILIIIKDEFDRFMQRLIDVKGQLEVLIRNHAGSGASYYLTSCTPNNLYKGNEIQWKKIAINKNEIQELLKKTELSKFEQVLGESEISKLEVEAINFELLFVNITRAWYNESILNAPFWNINILDKNEIAIPRISSKLILIRNVELKLPTNSNQNKILLKKNLVQTLGPFVINTAQLKDNKSLQLKSVNKSLHIDRKMIQDVSGKLNTKSQKQNTNISAIISKKQHQFVHVANRLKKRKNTTVIAKRATSVKRAVNIKSAVLMKPILVTTTFQLLINCELVFTDSVTGGPLNINPNQVKVFQENKPVNIQLKQKVPNSLEGSFNRNNSFKLIVTIPGYEKLEYQLHTKITDKKTTSIKKEIQLQKEVVEDFQIIGVIAKKIGAFPQPIKGADYL